jgi:hypothetical protein
MSALQQLVSLLDRDGVDLVIIQEGIAPHIRRRDGLHPVSREKSTRENVEHLLYEAGLLSHLENALLSDVREVPFSLEGRPFSADILMKRDRLQIRFATRTATDATPKPPIPPPPTRRRTAAPNTATVRNTGARSTL